MNSLVTKDNIFHWKRIYLQENGFHFQAQF